MGMKYFLLNAGSLEYFVSDQKWIGYTTLAHLVAEKMRNSEKDA